MLSIDWIVEECTKFGLVLDSLATQRMTQYSALLLQWNQRMNLTAITDPDEIAEKHFLDSLYLLKFCSLEYGATLIDVGTGAGFPGVVLKIARPDLQLTLLDSLNKRLVFLREVLEQLGLTAETLHFRAEEGGHKTGLREGFDYATARAVARLPVLAEYCLPFVRLGGRFICLKGPDARKELDEAKGAIRLLGGEQSLLHEYTLPHGDARAIVDINKISQTPAKYPRQGVKIAKKPL